MEYGSRRMAVRTVRAKRTAAMPRSMTRLRILQAMPAAMSRMTGTHTVPRQPLVRNQAAEAGE